MQIDAYRYSLYLSKGKLEMLLASPPRKRLHLPADIGSLSVKVNPGIFSVEASGARETSGEWQEIRKIEEHLRRERRVGPLASPVEWVKDRLVVRWAVVDDGVLFCGVRDGHAIALGGSAVNVTGESGKPPVGRGLTAPPALLEFLVKRAVDDPARLGSASRQDALLQALEFALRWEQLDPWVAVQPVEFLAKHHESAEVIRPQDGLSYDVIIASPLYVVDAQGLERGTNG